MNINIDEELQATLHSYGEIAGRKAKKSDTTPNSAALPCDTCPFKSDCAKDQTACPDYAEYLDPLAAKDEYILFLQEEGQHRRRSKRIYQLLLVD